METSLRNRGTAPCGGDISAGMRRMSKPKVIWTEETALELKGPSVKPQEPAGLAGWGGSRQGTHEEGWCPSRPRIGFGRGWWWADPSAPCASPDAIQLVPAHRGMDGGECQVLTHLPQLFPLLLGSQVMTSSGRSKGVTFSYKCLCG